MSPLHFTFTAMFTLSLLGLTFYRTHLLSALLCLESIMLSLFLAFSLWSLKFDSSAFSVAPMILLTFSACEASIGLALLVATMRTHGTDQLQNFNVLQC
uniref:NADH-ubiquinone oxidoreductase chain 4L n=1 Tax=Kryptolebias hermaphroditus TaxID=1747188 RepID=A0A343AMW2_9TELE|nr:NADH dehydrogenase subunit 4L [Kryptolebias hermaphroditus]API83175.1 NADH dehydrogenase subunit 4L [Kryptolebias hermaphroditus]